MNSNRNTNEASASSIIDSRIIINNGSFASTGKVSYFEGDIIEGEFTDYHLFEIGKKARVTIHTSNEVFVFFSVILAKDNGLLILLHPPEHTIYPTDRRISPRVPYQINALMKAVKPAILTIKVPLGIPLPMEIKNVSLTGIHFTTLNNIGMKKDYHADIELQLGTLLINEIAIVRVVDQQDCVNYGATFLNLQTDQLIELKSFLLLTQIENRAIYRVSNQ